MRILELEVQVSEATLRDIPGRGRHRKVSKRAMKLVVNLLKTFVGIELPYIWGKIQRNSKNMRCKTLTIVLHSLPTLLPILEFSTYTAISLNREFRNVKNGFGGK